MTLTLGVGVLLLAVTSYVIVARSLTTDLDRALLRETQSYAAAVAGGDGSSTATTASLVDASREYLSVHTQAATGAHPILMVRLTGGRVLSNSDALLELAGGNADPTPAGFATLNLDAEEYRMATAPIVDSDGEAAGVFQAALPTAYHKAIASSLATTLAVAGVAIVAIGASLSVWVARASLVPLREVARTAEHVTQSSLGDRVPYDGPRDEVGTMVAALNSMLNRLESAFGEQRRFVADASHELRTPLAVVGGNLDLLEHPKTSAEERAAALVAMREELARQERLVNDLLALARLDSGMHRPFQPLDVGTILEETAVRTRALGDRLVRVGAPADLWVRGDPDLLEQALMNLTRNAVAHTAEGGHIEIVAVAEGDEVLLRVADDGPGLRQEDLVRVFDRFYRAQGTRNRDSGSSGLGLPIVKRLVELHNGRVEAANREGGGAAFTISLPREERPA